jgi:hypothetical protein
MNRTARKGIALLDSISIVNWMEGHKTIEVAEENL